MKRVILIGNVACGKTTLLQAINGLELNYKKTQSLEVTNCTIDTPGEYLEHRSLIQALLVTAVDADLALFVQDAEGERFMFSPGMASAFPIPVAGVVTKTDLAAADHVERAKELLELAGASPVFRVSAVTGMGITKLQAFLQ